MRRFILLSFLIMAFAISSSPSSQAQPPSTEFLSPYLQQRIDAALVNLADPPSKSTESLIQRVVNELEVQLRVIKKKQERFLAIQREAEDRLQNLMAEELKRVEQAGLIGSSRETVELLLRNCLVELQRLNWQAAAEESPTNEKIVDIRQQLAVSQLRALEDQMMAAERQFELQEKRLHAIGALINAGQAPSDDLLKEQAKSEEVRAALESARQNREAFVLQMELDRSSEVEKSQLNSKKLQQQRDAIQQEIPELQKALREFAYIGNRRLAIEACEDRIRALDRKISELMIQETELEALIEFLTNELTPAVEK
jgi:hypothetical protein